MGETIVSRVQTKINNSDGANGGVRLKIMRHLSCWAYEQFANSRHVSGSADRAYQVQTK